MTKYENIQASFIILVIFMTLPLTFATLRVNFYKRSCPQAEPIIQHLVQERFSTDNTVTAALLRMHYHDCFIRGCDASILIDSGPNNKAEKDAAANIGVREFELIDKIKSRLETICPQTVSCADIIAVATRDSVALAGGPKYNVRTGRRDGLVSTANEVIMPGPTSSVSEAARAFNAKGISLKEMVTLLGGHSVGIAHCTFFRDRLFNFGGSGAPDPTMERSLLNFLQQFCGSDSNLDNRFAFLDQNTSFVFDNEYYKQLVNRRGVLQIDQEIAEDSTSSKFVAKLAASNDVFGQEFAKVMIKLGNLDVLEGNEGEIRRNCRAFN